MMRQHGGFEGNGQTFRIVSKLEPFSEGYGMNLARRTLLGLIKYPQTLNNLLGEKAPVAPYSFRQIKACEWHPPKGIYSDDLDVLNWVLMPLSENDRERFQLFSSSPEKHSKTQFKSFDCSIMELADDIAYGIHDLEDAIVTGVVSQADFDQHVIAQLQQLDDDWVHEISLSLSDQLFSRQHHRQKEAIGALVNYLITAIELIDQNDVMAEKFDEPLLRYQAIHPQTPAQVLKIFKNFVFRFVIKQTAIQQLEYRGQQIVMELFEALASDPSRLLPAATGRRWQDAKSLGLNEYRVIADYVSGMTDDYATNLYQMLFVPNNQFSYPNFNQ